MNKVDPEHILRNIGQRIVELRLRRDWSQSDLARRLGMSPGNLHHLENGQQNLTVRTLAKLAEALEVEVIELFEEPGSGRKSG